MNKFQFNPNAESIAYTPVIALQFILRGTHLKIRHCYYTTRTMVFWNPTLMFGRQIKKDMESSATLLFQISNIASNKMNFYG
jgi:hypothetical protein